LEKRARSGGLSPFLKFINIMKARKEGSELQILDRELSIENALANDKTLNRPNTNWLADLAIWLLLPTLKS
jgi:hypothetical protein